MNIEKLARESGAACVPNTKPNEGMFIFEQKQLEAFAKALQQSSKSCSSCNDTGDIHSADGQYAGKCPCKQSSEPVADVTIEDSMLYTEWCASSKLTRGACPLNDSQVAKIKGLTHPPASVPLEKYNKLERELDIAKDVLEAHTLTHVYDKLIAEAEGEEG